MEIKNFNEEIINSKGLTIVDFWAPWCTVCITFIPILEKVEKQIDNVIFYRLNVDNNKDIAKEYAVMSIPTIVLYKDGKEFRRHIGFLNEEELKRFLEH